MKLPKDYLLTDLLNHNVRSSINIFYGPGESVWMHPPVHRILGWSSRPSNLNLKRNVWRLNQISQIIDNDIFVKGDPAVSDLSTLNRFPSLLYANLINSNGSKIGVIADFIFNLKTGNILYYLVSRSNPKIPGSSRWKLDIQNIIDQQPGLVFCSYDSLNDLSIIKSSLKNEFLKKGKNIVNKFDDMKNIAANKLEDWLEEEEYNDSENNSINTNDFDSEKILNNVKTRDKKIYSDKIKSRSSKNINEDDPWI